MEFIWDRGGAYEQWQDCTLGMEQKMTNFNARQHFLYLREPYEQVRAYSLLLTSHKMLKGFCCDIVLYVHVKLNQTKLKLNYTKLN